MENLILKALMRKEFGKNICKQIRKKGQIPAILYKEGKKGIPLQVNTDELWRILHTHAGENAIINIHIDDNGKIDKRTAIVQDIEIDPVTDQVLHIDFHEISLKDQIKVKVPIVTKGESIGVKNNNGILVQSIWELEIECLATEIPEQIFINIEQLKIGDIIHIKEIELPKDVKAIGNEDRVVLTINPPKLGIDEEEAAEEEPEIIKKGKKEEEQEEK